MTKCTFGPKDLNWSWLLIADLHLCVLLIQAATKVVAGAEKKEVDKKEDVVMAVATARDDGRATLNSAKQAMLRSGTFILFVLCCTSYKHLKTVVIIMSLQSKLRNSFKFTWCSSLSLGHN